MTPEKMLKKFRDLPDDVERWKWVLKNKDKGVIVVCDNDVTFVEIRGHDDSENFRDHIGWSGGVFCLLDALGIEAESV